MFFLRHTKKNKIKHEKKYIFAEYPLLKHAVTKKNYFFVSILNPSFSANSLKVSKFT